MSNPSIEVEIGANAEKLSKGLSDAQKKLQDFSKQALAVGKGLSLAVSAPLAGLATIAVLNFNKQAQAIGQVESALKSTGSTAGFTSKELQGIASDLQNISTFGDEEILQKVTAQLLTFTNVTGEAFKRTQVAALDLSTRLGGDLQSATLQLGKALNDPIAGLSALSRTGIQFSDTQKDLIRSLVETNQVAEAQNVILNELERQFGGSAKAAAELGTGPLQQLKNQFGDLLEDVGKIILEAINPLIAKTKEVITFFQGLSDQTKKTIVIIGAITAAIGPLLVVLGSIGLALPAITAGFVALTGPIGLVTIAVGAAVGLLIKLNLELAKTSQIAGQVRASNLEETTKNIKNQVNELAEAYQKINPQLTANEAKQKALNDTLESYKFRLEETIRTDFRNLDRIGFLRDQIKVIEDLKNSYTELGITLVETGKKAKLTFEEFSKLSDIRNEEVFRRWNEEAEKYNATIAETAALQRRLESSLQSVVKQIDGKSIFEIGDIGAAPTLEIADIDDSKKTEFLLKAKEFTDQASAIFQNAVGSGIASFASDIGTAIGEGSNVLQAGSAGLLKAVAGIANKLGQAAIGIGVSMLAIRKAFTNPFTAIAAGVALVALSGLISSQVPKITSGSGGGASTGLTGGSGQSFGNQSQPLQTFDRQEQLVATVRGGDLLFTIKQAERKNR